MSMHSELFVRRAAPTTNMLLPARRLTFLDSGNAVLPRVHGGTATNAATANATSAPCGLVVRLFRLEVVDQQLATLAIAVRVVLGNLDNVEDGGALMEDFVHLFE